MFLAGRGIDDTDLSGRPLVDDNLCVLLNAEDGDITFRLPAFESVREPWELLLDTADDHAEETKSAGEPTRLIGRSLKVFRSSSRVLRAGGALHRLGATYRLQVCPQFTFKDALAVTQYLSDLGITDIYTSPLLQAVAGSEHGYDVVDHGALNAELGGEPGVLRVERRAAAPSHRADGRLRAEPHGHRQRQNSLWDDRPRARAELAVRGFLRRRLDAGPARTCATESSYRSSTASTATCSSAAISSSRSARRRRGSATSTAGSRSPSIRSDRS